MTTIVKSTAPWSVKGVDRAARAAARDAAQAAGLTIGQWIDRAILRHAGAISDPEPATQVAPAAVGHPAPPADDRLKAVRLVELAEQVDLAERHMSEQLVPVGKAVEGLARRLIDIETRRQHPPETPDQPAAEAPPAPPGINAGIDHAAMASAQRFAQQLEESLKKTSQKPAEPPPTTVRTLLPPEPRAPETRRAEAEPVEPIQPPPEIIDFESRLKMSQDARVLRRRRVEPDVDAEEAPRPKRRWGLRITLGFVSLILVGALGLGLWVGYLASRKPGIDWSDMPAQMELEAKAIWLEHGQPGWAALKEHVSAVPMPSWPDRL
ncbi:MAG: hypothetical protein FJX52_01985, partial [Alphaproteobacteria bacterium]|nr:hypothetical protein [Alphaproteobacteria bacterium]